VPQVHHKLQCPNPKIVSKYKESLKQQVAHHTTPERIDALMAIPIGSWTRKHTAPAKKIDATLGDSQELSESKCNKGKSRVLDWSAELYHAGAAGKIISYWELRLAKLKGRRKSSKTISLRRIDTDIPIHSPLNADKVRGKILSSTNFLSEV
jgi:hypothetical protein